MELRNSMLRLIYSRPKTNGRDSIDLVSRVLDVYWIFFESDTN